MSLKSIRSAAYNLMRGRLPDARDLLIIVGLGLLTYGVALESRAAAFMVCGGVLLIIGLASLYEIVRRSRG